MIGKYEIVVENAYIKYEFSVCRNITIVRGDSATGKTTLVEMIRAYNEEDDTGIEIHCEKPLSVVYGRDWKGQLERSSGHILFIDEQNRFVRSVEFAEMLKKSDNYFVIVTREKVSTLPYSVTEIYGIRTRGKYAGLVGEYTANEFYRIYGEMPSLEFAPDIIITEDSNSGFEFWNNVIGRDRCLSAMGKTNVLEKLKKNEKKGVNYLIVVDGAAFGSEIEELIQYIKYRNRDVKVYAPESFEYLILTSGIFNSKEITEKCRNTYSYADSSKYMSWEQFYTSLLVEETVGTQMQYRKQKLNQYYLSERNRKLILEELPDNLVIASKDLG